MEYFNFRLDDYVNAGLYASEQVKKFRYQTQRSEKRWNLPPYLISEEPYKNEFYLPEELQSTFKSYTYRFPEPSCKIMSCFFNLRHDKLCPKRREDRQFTGLKIGGKVYPVCQDGCYMNQFSEVPFVSETYYENNKCFMRGVGFKHYCIFPKSRNEHIPNLPAFAYDEQTGKCSFTKQYCDFFGTEFDATKKECYITDAQHYVEEFLTGQNLFRLFKILSTKTPRLESNADNDASNIVYSLLHDAGIDASLVLLKHATLKSIPLLNSGVANLLINQFQSKYGLAIARAAAVSLVLQTAKSSIAAQLAVKISTAVGKASTVVGFILLYFTVVGLILDSVDPLSLKSQITPEHMQKLKYGFEYLFAKQFDQNLECTPEFFISVYSKGNFNETENKIYMEHMCIYLDKLRYTADGLKTIRSSETGLSVEQTIARILHATSKLDDDHSLKPKMDNLFSKFAVFFSFLIPIFLAVSI